MQDCAGYVCAGWSHLLPSPLASLCFLLYATRSLNVKPSCAVMKLMLCCGPRPPSHFLPPLFAHQLPACPCRHSLTQPVVQRSPPMLLRRGMQHLILTPCADRQTPVRLKAMCRLSALRQPTPQRTLQWDTRRPVQGSQALLLSNPILNISCTRRGRAYLHLAQKRSRWWGSRRRRTRRPAPRAPRCP